MDLASPGLLKRASQKTLSFPDGQWEQITEFTGLPCFGCHSVLFFFSFKECPSRLWAARDHPQKGMGDLGEDFLKALVWEKLSAESCVFY